jgi:A/G-specific adenine glycosylase
MSTPPSASIAERLLAWFAEHARDLPWRHTRDPYCILVVEIMLQQTQVERVVPKYLAFLEAFPDLEALAAAPTGEVIRQWAGLGYNRRAVNLQRAARMIVEQFGGVFPREVAELRRLPGVGPYTAGAVACFAFEQDVSFIDTNIRRVLRRSLVGPDDSTPLSDRQLIELGAALLPAGQGWRWNQALIELGALVCSATTPACRRCPLRADCRAYGAWLAADQALLHEMAQAEPRPLRRAAERRNSYRPSEPFVGSNRWYRGRLIAALRALPPAGTIPLSELGPQVRDGFSPADLPWLHELVLGLARDGLLVLDGDLASLP